jgi:hypothetical protein
VLTTGPKGCGFETGQGYGFLREIKIRSTPSFGWKVKPEGPMPSEFTARKSPTGMDRLNSHFLCPFRIAPETSLVTARALSLLSYELDLVDLVYSLIHIAITRGKYNRLKAAVLTAVSPHHNNQSTIYTIQNA